MASIYVGWVLALVLILLGCANGLGRLDVRSSAVPKQFRERQVIVVLPDRLRSDWPRLGAAIEREYGIEQIGEFPLDSIRVNCLVYSVPRQQDPGKLIASLRADPHVESAQVNRVFPATQSSHNDAYAAMQYAPKALHVDRAHRYSTGRGVKVAVVDTGVDKTHVDLKGQVSESMNFVENGEQTFTKEPHGTAVAGVIAARADNDAGIFGIAPDAELMALKACWYPGDTASQALCSSWTLAKAIDHVINAGIRVLNMSLAGPEDELLQRLLKTAVARGVVILAAVYNNPDTEGPGFPASMPNTLAVIANDENGQVQIPHWVRREGLFAAPGYEVLTTAPRDAYDFLSGSSIAVAHVSGVVALLLEQAPDLSASELQRILQDSGHPVVSGRGKTPVTVVDACAALNRVNAQYCAD